MKMTRTTFGFDSTKNDPEDVVRSCRRHTDARHASQIACIIFCAIYAAATAGTCAFSRAQEFPPFFRHEQKTIEVRDPWQLPSAPIPDVPPPPTVSQPTPDIPVRQLTLDEAIAIALSNSDVIRILVGDFAVSSGATIYDPAIVNTEIDEERARFDPFVVAFNGFNRNETPLLFDPVFGRRIIGTRNDNYELLAEMSKQTFSGGRASIRVEADRDRLRPGLFPLNPRTASAAELSYIQPLLQGGGWAANRAPIILARINTEISYFQLKDATQDLVAGVIEAYWALVFARLDQVVRQRQVDYARQVMDHAQGRMETGAGDIEDVAQARTTYALFQANVVAAESNALQRETVLRNILGIPPSGAERLVPVTLPLADLLDFNWEELLVLAERFRPAVIELKLVLEADQQQLILANNQALPRVDAVGLYRWNGLEGTTPLGYAITERPGEFQDWTLGVNFSVPLGLRKERANLRRRELIIARDESNLQQSLHQASHLIARNLQNIAQFYKQYESFKASRQAAQENLKLLRARYDIGVDDRRDVLLRLLQTIEDWGNSVSLEARTLASYNTELSRLERTTGTILEAHSIRFSEERFAAIGPLGRAFHDHGYPLRLPPLASVTETDTATMESFPAEQFFDVNGGSQFENIPAPGPDGGDASADDAKDSAKTARGKGISRLIRWMR